MFKNIAFLLLLGTCSTFGQPRRTEQNLVPNPSFERNSGCPKFNESISKVVAWYRSHTFSADYFHSCVPPNQRMSLGVPVNMFGYQEPRTGEAYAGISFCGEALTVKLIRPLIKDSIYKVEFFVNLADSSDVGTRYLGMYISNREPRYRLDNKNNLISEFILNHPPQIRNPRDRYLTDTENWTSINGIYTAKGGEEFIAIGGFYAYNDSLVQIIRPARLMKKNYRGWEEHVGYYYVDDVSIIPYSMNWQTDVNYILKYVYFDFDQIDLLPESVDELTRLSAHLKKYPSYNISIKGHTDDFGTDEYNNILSINRAKSVLEWLANTGEIDPQRITYSGAGRSEPIAENDTEYGRSLNRRVEFILTDTVTNTEIKSNF
jgi:outer membrane protein OmpA-like peptidoglycan-associated protein